MQSTISSIEGFPIAIASWPATLDNPKQEMVDVHAGLRALFEENGWDSGIVIHDGSKLEIDFGSLVLILAELRSEDAAWLSERVKVRLVGPPHLTDVTVTAHGQEQYSGRTKDISACESLDQAILEAKALLQSE
ncbi:MAG: hypothetical protein GYB68_06555 [Chloroflexi bacterium]|nr:hypothetical protein [Chloroflexota bacterium]